MLVFLRSMGEASIALRKVRDVVLEVRSWGTGKWLRICSRSSVVLKVAVMADEEIVGVVEALSLVARGCWWWGLVP